jgi:centromeric protein E
VISHTKRSFALRRDRQRCDEFPSRSLESIARNVSEEAQSVADAYGVDHQDQDYESFIL